MIKAALLICGVLMAASTASAAEVPLEWAIPADNKPYPTQNINVGDSILFNWQGLHGVYLIETPACPAEFPDGPNVLAATAPLGSYTWTAAAPGTYNFACQVGDHCLEGMLVSVIVGEGAALAPGAEAPTAPALAPASAPLGEDSEGDSDGM